jgi:hypothetical protein
MTKRQSGGWMRRLAALILIALLPAIVLAKGPATAAHTAGPTVRTALALHTADTRVERMDHPVRIMGPLRDSPQHCR